MLGTVKWFNDEKGYGFIAPDGGGDDVFVHHSAITGQSGRRTLTQDQRVEFDTQPGRRSLEATDLRIID